MSDRTKPDYEVIVIGAGVAGIYQIKLLADLGVNATVLEAAGDLGGTWYANRYPGARFDSESYTYGFSFSKELLDEWHWSERFSGQPENLRYLNYVADKFDLRKYTLRTGLTGVRTRLAIFFPRHKAFPFFRGKIRGQPRTGFVDQILWM